MNIHISWNERRQPVLWFLHSSASTKVAKAACSGVSQTFSPCSWTELSKLDFDSRLLDAGTAG